MDIVRRQSRNISLPLGIVWEWVAKLFPKIPLFSINLGVEFTDFLLIPSWFQEFSYKVFLKTRGFWESYWHVTTLRTRWLGNLPSWLLQDTIHNSGRSLSRSAFVLTLRYLRTCPFHHCDKPMLPPYFNRSIHSSIQPFRTCLLCYIPLTTGPVTTFHIHQGEPL